MALFSVKKLPADFPECLHLPFKTGLGEHVVFSSADKALVNGMYNKWKAFRLSLVRGPRHQTAVLAKEFEYTAGQRFNGLAWELVVTLRPLRGHLQVIAEALGADAQEEGLS